MTTATAVLALLISIASLAFGIYQYRILHTVRVGEKATALLRLAHDIRRKSQDLEHTIDSTDYAEDQTEFLAKVNQLVEVQVARLATSKKVSLATLAEAERVLLGLELELELLHKQVAKLGRFNEEVRAHEKATRNEA